MKRGFEPIFHDDTVSNGRSQVDLETDPLMIAMAEGRELMQGELNEDEIIPLETVRLSEVEMTNVKWLWPDRIPLGKQSLIVGDPGLGKSFLTIDIASRVTTGTAWPDNRDQRNEPGTVLILSAEDGISDTIGPRLKQARADLSRVHVLKGVRQPENSDVLSHFSLERDLRHLEGFMRKFSDTRLIVIDPLSAYLGKSDSHRDAEIRGVLGPLADFAETRDVSVLGVVHNNKAVGMKAVHRVMGSTAFVASARTAWLVCKDREDPTGNRRLMLQIKNNLAPNPGGLAFQIVKPGVIEWFDGTVSTTADEALAPPKQGRPPSTRDEVERWIKEELNDGPVPAAWMLGEGEKKFAPKTLQRAKENLGIESRYMAVEGSESKQSHWCSP